MSLCKTRDRFHLRMDLELLGFQSGNLRVSTNVPRVSAMAVL